MTSDRQPSRAAAAVQTASSTVGSVDGAPAGPVSIGDERFEFTPHNCFACGSLNTHGLGLLLHVEHGRSWTELALERSFEGWEGIAHGGIICTILDEVMAWALVGTDNWGVTARMSVEFRRPVPVGRPIRATGIVTKARRRIVETSAVLVDVTTGEVLATATGTYVAAGEERKRELQDRYRFRTLPEEASPRRTPDPVDGASTSAPTSAAATAAAEARP